MKTSTKKFTANTITVVFGIYSFLGYAAFLLPALGNWVGPTVRYFGSEFLLIPVAMLILLVVLVVPLAILIGAVMLVHFCLYKAFGLDW